MQSRGSSKRQDSDEAATTTATSSPATPETSRTSTTTSLWSGFTLPVSDWHPPAVSGVGGPGPRGIDVYEEPPPPRNTSIFRDPAKTANSGYSLWGARPNSLLGPLQGVASRPRTVGITPGVAVSESSGPGYRHSDSQPPSRGAGTTRNPQQDHMPLLPQPPVIMNPAAGALLGPFRGDFLVGRRSGPDVFRLRHPRKVSFWEFPGEEVFC